jgi:SHS2 domain-containing protein
MYQVITLSHTADIRLKIEANSPEELFLAGLQCMGNIIKENLCSSDFAGEISRYVEIHTRDMTILFVDFLSEVLTISHTENSIFCRMEVIHLDDFNIKALIYGVKVDSFDEDIKAVTYHEAEVKKLAQTHWQTNLIFDI